MVWDEMSYNQFYNDFDNIEPDITEIVEDKTIIFLQELINHYLKYEEQVGEL